MDQFRKLIREEVKKILERKVYLTELGESKPYSFEEEKVIKGEFPGDPDDPHKEDQDRLVTFRAVYSFETERGTEHEVKFEQLEYDHPVLERVLEVSLTSRDHISTFSNPKPLTGDDKAVRVISTVIEIAKHLYRNHGEVIEGFAFSGWTKSGSDFDKMQSVQSQRSKIYRYLLKQKMSGVKVDTIKNEDGEKFLYVEL